MKYNYFCKNKCYNQTSSISQPSHSNLLEVYAAPMEMFMWQSVWFMEVNGAEEKAVLVLSYYRPTESMHFGALAPRL